MTTAKKILKSIFFTFKILFISLTSLLLIILILFLININSWQSLFKNTVSAKNNLEQSLNYLLEEDIERSLNKSNLAKENFDESIIAIRQIKNTNPLFKIKEAKNQLNDLEKIIVSGKIISLTLNQSANLFKEINQTVSVTNRKEALSFSEKKELIEISFNLEPSLKEIKENLDLVLLNLEELKGSLILYPFKKSLNKLDENIKDLEIVTNRALPIIKLLPVLSGYPEPSRFLLLFQNNDELRPTGGFIGSYATLEVANIAEDIDMQAGDIYHLDMPSIDHLKTVPPEPISKYMRVKKWYLRDSNWSPDWPSSATFIEWLFYQESKHANLDFNDLNGIIAITPNLVAQLLNLTGPINLNGEVYTAENLQKLLQYQTGVAYQEEDIASWDRKDVINDLALILKDRLQKISGQKILELIKILDEAIIKKDVLIYFTDPNNQLLAKELEASGEIKKVDHDYLMIVDANLAAFKTDAVMIKDWNYQLKNTPEGIIANLKLNYRHQGGFDWRTTRYRSYTRV